MEATDSRPSDVSSVKKRSAQDAGPSGMASRSLNEWMRVSSILRQYTIYGISLSRMETKDRGEEAAFFLFCLYLFCIFEEGM